MMTSHVTQKLFRVP
uniref:Uncharacterized protein n=1 Tax=Anguilla anguilla TaxID=7936 RepID=A0A0E9PP86_ANGAN